MRGRLQDKTLKEDGAVMIVEAAFVFPIMFMVLFTLIYMGNAYYVRSQIDAVVQIYAVEGAEYCADPMLQSIKSSAPDYKFSSVQDLKIEPYRYLFGNMNKIERDIGEAVYKELNSGTASFFKNMSPQLKTPTHKIAKFNNHILYATFSVEVECRVEFPIKYFGEGIADAMVFHARAEVPVNDTAEFIRNVDMVLDVFYATGMMDKIKGTFGKVNEFIHSFTGK